MGLRAIFDYLRPTMHPSPPPLPSVRSSAPLMPNFRWVGRGSEVRVGLFHLFEPLVYVYDGRRGRCDEPAAIDISLVISSGSATPAIRELPYWPRYVDLQAHQRRIFLQWLANGRTTSPPELGYTFLFFYNLERRALIDRSDIRLIASEVVRLRKQYAAPGQEISGSWEGYSGRFLWVLMLAHKESLNAEDVRAHVTGTSHWTEDNLAAALGCLAMRDVRLSASLAYSIASFLPESTRSIVQRRVPEEFQELFKSALSGTVPRTVLRCDARSTRKRTCIARQVVPYLR